MNLCSASPSRNAAAYNAVLQSWNVTCTEGQELGKRLH